MYPRFLQFGALVVSTYGVLAVVAAFSAIALWRALAARLGGLDPDQVQSAGLLAVTVLILGSRAAVVIANWRGFLEAPLLILMAGTLATGSATAWGAAAAAAVTVLFLLRHGVRLLPAAATAAPALPLALGVLDIADFAAGSHFGAPTHVPWAVTYTSRFAARTAGVPLGVPLHPVQLYAAAAHFLLAAALIVLLRHTDRLIEVPALGLSAEGLVRFSLAPLEGGFDAEPLLLHVGTPAQLAAMAMVLAGGLLWLRPHAGSRLHG